MTTVLFSQAPMPVEVTYGQDGLFVAMTVLKLVGSTWTQVSRTAAANTNSGSGTYGAIFTPPDATSNFIVELAAFTDNSFTTYLEGTLASSRSFKIDPSILAALNLIRPSSQFGLNGRVSMLSVRGVVKC